jgi:hypothetical protein
MNESSNIENIGDLEKKYLFLPMILKSYKNTMKEMFQRNNENTVRIILISIATKNAPSNK